MSANLADAVIDLYRRHAQAWTTARGARLMESDWLDAFCALLAPGAEVLDIGCGSGRPIACELVRRGYRVTGLDSAPQMIALFKTALPDQAVVVGDMRTASLGRRFGGVLAWDSFFHLSPGDQRAMFAIFQRHADPGAALMFTSGPSAAEAIGELEGEPLYHASLDAAEYQALLDAHGFKVVRHVVEDPDCGGHTVWLARRL